MMPVVARELKPKNSITKNSRPCPASQGEMKRAEMPVRSKPLTRRREMPFWSLPNTSSAVPRTNPITTELIVRQTTDSGSLYCT